MFYDKTDNNDFEENSCMNFCWDVNRLEVFNNEQFDKWILEGVAPAIKPSLKLYEEILRLGFKIILLTGRHEDKRNITVTNLAHAGYQKWDRLILR